MMGRVLLFLVLTGWVSRGADLERLRVVSLDTGIQERESAIGGAPDFVYAMAFSPADKFLAIAIGGHETPQGPVTHIIVLETKGFQQVFSSDISAASVSKVQWSLDESRIVVQSFTGTWVLEVAHVEASCDVGEMTMHPLGFVSRDWFAVARNSLTTTTLRFYNTRCERQGSTTTPFAINYADADAGSGLVAASRAGVGIQVFRVNPWDGIGTARDIRTGMRVMFFGGGRGICAAPRAPDSDATMRCWLIGQGDLREVSSIPAKNAELLPVASSTSVPLIAIQDTALRYNAFTEGTRVNFKQWIVWNAVEGKVIGSVSARSQESPLRFGRKKSGMGIPYVAALAANGKLFAIAGSQSVEVFRCP